MQLDQKRSLSRKDVTTEIEERDSVALDVVAVGFLRSGEERYSIICCRLSAQVAEPG